MIQGKRKSLTSSPFTHTCGSLGLGQACITFWFKIHKSRFLVTILKFHAGVIVIALKKRDQGDFVAKSHVVK